MGEDTGEALVETVRKFKENAESIINSDAISTDSVEGWIIIIIGLCLAHFIWKKASKAAVWCMCGILAFQVLYILSLTGFNEIIPLNRVFKYDVLTAIAQCFAGTKICSVLLWLDSFLLVSCAKLWSMGADFFRAVKRILVDFFMQVKAIGDSGQQG